MDIKPIETEYNGYLFRSRLEARWAVFFDELGVTYEYEPEGFELPSGERYLPDFRLRCFGRGGKEEPFDLYVEVKGKVSNRDIKRINEFHECGHRIIILGQIPYGNNIYDLFYNIENFKNANEIEGAYYCFDFYYIDYDAYPCALGITKNNKFGIFGVDWCDEEINESKTLNAYKKARKARFEFKN